LELLPFAVRGAYWNATHTAMNPEARCRAGHPCLEGSKSRNRLSGGGTHAAGFFLADPGRKGKQLASDSLAGDRKRRVGSRSAWVPR